MKYLVTENMKSFMKCMKDNNLNVKDYVYVKDCFDLRNKNVNKENLYFVGNYWLNKKFNEIKDEINWMFGVDNHKEIAGPSKLLLNK